MRVIGGLESARGRFSRCSVAIGNFDGVHLGHQALLKRAMVGARQGGDLSMVVTFDPHPEQVLFPQRAPRMLTPLWRKLELFEVMGMDIAVVQPFDMQYAALEAEEFLERDLFGALRPRYVVVGSNFSYGKERAGTADTLGRACDARGVEFHAHSPVHCAKGEIISSTRIRNLITQGEVEEAAVLLGRPFDQSGVVVHGKHIGRTIGFPTANLGELDPLQAYPQDGVYLVRAFTVDGFWNGVANVGYKPTVGLNEKGIEVHLFDYSGDLYGIRMSLEYLQRLRSEKTFASLGELKKAIALDCAQAKEVLGRFSLPGLAAPFAHNRLP